MQEWPATLLTRLFPPGDDDDDLSLGRLSAIGVWAAQA